MIGCIVLILAYDLINAALHYPLLADPTAALAAVTVTTVVIIGAILWTRSRAIPGFLSAILAGTALTVTILGGWDLEAGSALALAYFAAGAGAPALCFVAFYRPWWESTAAVLIVTAAAAAMVYRADPGWSPLERSLPAVMANLVAVAAVLGARITIDRAVRAVEWDEEMERQAGSARAQLAIGRQVMADRLGRVQRWVLPFLTKLTCGDLDPADPAVRTEATLLEAAVRDDIRLGRHIDDRTRALIAQARASDHQVEINADADLARVLPAQLISQLLSAALDGVQAPERTVLTLSGSIDSTTLSLFVTPPPIGPTLTSLATGLGAITNAGPTFLLIRVPLGRTGTRQPSPSVDDSGPATTAIGQHLCAESSRFVISGPDLVASAVGASAESGPPMPERLATDAVWHDRARRAGLPEPRPATCHDPLHVAVDSLSCVEHRWSVPGDTAPDRAGSADADGARLEDDPGPTAHVAIEVGDATVASRPAPTR